MPLARQAKSAKKAQETPDAQKLEKAVLLAQLELARAERAQADDKIRRLEQQLFGTEQSSASESEKSDLSGSDSEDRQGRQMDMGEMLFERLLEGLGDGFPASIRKSAQEAVKDGPEADERSRKGCNWIGGIQLAWTSPPTVRKLKPHVQEHFPRPIKPGDVLSEVDGTPVDGLSRRNILGLLKKFKGSVGFKRVHHKSHQEAIRESAKDALKSGPDEDAAHREGQNWIWGFLLAWTSPPVVRDVRPEVQEHFPSPITPGDFLHQVDGRRVEDLSRTEVLKLLQKYNGRIGFRSGKDEDFRKSAKEALRSGPQEDAESGQGCDWIGGILLAWTSPPVVRDVKPGMQKHFERPIAAGDILHTVDGKRVHGLSREEVLKLLSKHNGSLCFRQGDDMDEKVRSSAREAARSGPEEDAESGKGCDWIGGILLAWTSPPVVRDVKPEAQKHFPKPISAGDVLRQVDGKLVGGLTRAEILALLQGFQGSFGFRSGADMDEDVRVSARKALDQGPEEDEQSGKGCNWIGGILLAWTSPPVVRDVKPSVQKHFPRPITPGDVLRMVDGELVQHMSRAEILRALVHFDGELGFRSKHPAEISLADLLRRLGDP
ncbi:unnamed protein product [Symbiodinium natans]|uniref:PDZ domain-containing protein n=1 Tax=Symbiodinium natans TaxID=878477 RepID=A0A812QWU9_9DINO|nr:unnamed protein product [Symbiodinium natans]